MSTVAIPKFVAIGPESTGKSTLCSMLASRYQARWCPEYARTFLEKHGADYSFATLLTIAQGQVRIEDQHTEHAEETGHLLFVDTDMHVMRVWCEYVFQDCHKFILDEIACREYAGYFLCAPDLPWQADSLREHPEEQTRQELFLFYQELLTAQHIPWVVIRGGYAERLQSAIDFVDGVLAASSSKSE